MADTTSAAPALDRATEQARIRKERREAKIRAGGSARLNKITGLGGGLQRDAPPQPTAIPAEDPEEVDISVSEHFYQPNSTSRQMNANMNSVNFNKIQPGQQGPQISDEQLRSMMLGIPPPNMDNTGGVPPNPFAGFPGMERLGGPQMAGMEDDPMMKIMQQMLGGGGAEPGVMPGFPGMPSMNPTAANANADPYVYIWRIIHAVFALSLGLYISLTTPFAGTKLEREQTIYAASTSTPSDIYDAGINGIKFFWIFATMELMLQTSRFWMEQGVVRHSGWFGMVVGFLPEPWKGYLLILSRYARIWTTISADAFAVVFVLGVCAWWRGM